MFKEGNGRVERADGRSSAECADGFVGERREDPPVADGFRRPVEG